MTAPELTLKRRSELAELINTADAYAIVDALHAEIAGEYEARIESHRVARRHLAGDLIALADGAKLNMVTAHGEAAWRRMAKLEAERDALQKRVEELAAERDAARADQLAAVNAMAKARREAQDQQDRFWITYVVAEEIVEARGGQFAKLWHAMHTLRKERDALQKRVEALTLAAAHRAADAATRAAHNEACARWVREHGGVSLDALADHCRRYTDGYVEVAAEALRALLKDEKT